MQFQMVFLPAIQETLSWVSLLVRARWLVAAEGVVELD
jgi:hypothetical protein